MERRKAEIWDFEPYKAKDFSRPALRLGEKIFFAKASANCFSDPRIYLVGDLEYVQICRKVAAIVISIVPFYIARDAFGHLLISNY